LLSLLIISLAEKCISLKKNQQKWLISLNDAQRYKLIPIFVPTLDQNLRREGKNNPIGPHYLNPSWQIQS